MFCCLHVLSCVLIVHCVLCAESCIYIYIYMIYIAVSGVCVCHIYIYRSEWCVCHIYISRLCRAELCAMCCVLCAESTVVGRGCRGSLRHRTGELWGGVCMPLCSLHALP